jgi:hypothetical protein
MSGNPVIDLVLNSTSVSLQLFIWLLSTLQVKPRYLPVPGELLCNRIFRPMAIKLVYVADRSRRQAHSPITHALAGEQNSAYP